MGGRRAEEGGGAVLFSPLVVGWTGALPDAEGVLQTESLSQVGESHQLVSTQLWNDRKEVIGACWFKHSAWQPFCGAVGHMAEHSSSDSERALS